MIKTNILKRSHNALKNEPYCEKIKTKAMLYEAIMRMGS